MKKTKVYNKGFIIFLALAVVFSIGYPIVKRYCIDPNKWKKNFLNESLNQYLSRTDSTHIYQFCDCMYDYFQKTYGNVSNFPDLSTYLKEDKVAIFKCTIYNLVSDSTEKQFYIDNMDSVILKIK